MSKCSQCDYVFKSKQRVCPRCGAPVDQEVEEENYVAEKVCPKCNTIVEHDMFFCPNCGNRLDESEHYGNDSSNISNSHSTVKEVVNRVKQNEFIQSVKQDVGNSQSINMIKEKVKSKSNSINLADKRNKSKIIILGIIALVVVALLIIGTNIHRCEECDKLYFGKKHTISFWGESEDVCKECYDDFYSWDW